MKRRIVITYEAKYVNRFVERRILKACDKLGESLRVTFYEPKEKKETE